MTEKEALYGLCRIPELGPVSIRRLKEKFGTCLRVWEAGEKELRETGGLTERKARKLLEGKPGLEAARREYEGVLRTGVRFVAEEDGEYPERLKPFRDRPAALFVKGKLPEDNRPSAAIVGARGCTEYGRDMAEKLSAGLSAAGVQIISGLAAGVDGAAHKGALSGGYSTYGVLGCGINICYPRENYGLFRAMEAKGGILSEFVPGTPPAAGNFPLRNRIISGLSDAVIIIEAREKSGSLITADLALEQGKEVFALPGRLTDALSAGCNRLIQNGAGLLLDAGDVLEFFGLKYEKKLTLHEFSKNGLAKKEDLLYSVLDSRPRHLEEIMHISGLSVTECMEVLLKLEMAGLVQNAGSQYYCRKM